MTKSKQVLTSKNMAAHCHRKCICTTKFYFQAGSFSLTESQYLFALGKYSQAVTGADRLPFFDVCRPEIRMDRPTTASLFPPLLLRWLQIRSVQ